MRSHWVARVRVLALTTGGLSGLLSWFPAWPMQEWNGRKIYFGDSHWHSCLSQDADRSPEEHYDSMLHSNHLDFSMQSEHAEGAESGIFECGEYLEPRFVPGPDGSPIPLAHAGNSIATAMKNAADAWNGRVREDSPFGRIEFVTFPGYEWATDASCWRASLLGGKGPNFNTDAEVPGHISYFFDRTDGWHMVENDGGDVWAPGTNDNVACDAADFDFLGFTHFDGRRDDFSEIMGQLVHQRDDPDRPYDLLIQINHPAKTRDQGTRPKDEVARWTGTLADHGESYTTNCRGLRTRYGATGVEWIASQESSLGSTAHHSPDLCGPGCFEPPFHDAFHQPELWVSSRGLREGLALAMWGGSDSHNGTREDPSSFPGRDRGAGGAALVAVYANEASRPGIWDALSNRRSYGLSRFRGVGPVHKGRVDFWATAPDGTRDSIGEYGEVAGSGSYRDFTIAAASEVGAMDVHPLTLHLYRVAPDTPLSTSTRINHFWLDDEPGDPGKFGESLGTFANASGAPEVTHTFRDVLVRPGDAVFAVVIYSDYTWVDDVYANEDGDKISEVGGAGYPHSDNPTYARTTPIWFEAPDEVALSDGTCELVTFADADAAAEPPTGGYDVGIPGDDGVAAVGLAPGPGVELREWTFSLDADHEFVDLSFATPTPTLRENDPEGHLFAIRIDGRLLYSGRGAIDHADDRTVDLEDIHFPLRRGVHRVQVHMDDQERAFDRDIEYGCNDPDYPYGFLDALTFHDGRDDLCGDHTPPNLVCRGHVTGEWLHPGVAVDYLVEATDDFDPAPSVSCSPPEGSLLAYGTTDVLCNATDAAGNSTAVVDPRTSENGSCSFTVTLQDTTPPSITCAPDLALDCTQLGGTPASDPRIAAFLAGAAASDAGDPDVSAGPSDAPAVFPGGSTPVTFTATDFAGNAASCQASVIVTDTLAPAITSNFSIHPTALWPPDLRLVSIDVATLTASDACDTDPIFVCSVGSDEPVEATSGDGATDFDIVLAGEPIFTQGSGERAIESNAGVANLSLELRAERDARLDGRVYSTRCVAVDASGNRSAPKAGDVFVPRRLRDLVEVAP